MGNDQVKAQSEKDSHSKSRGGKKQTNTYTMNTFRNENSWNLEKCHFSWNCPGISKNILENEDSSLTILKLPDFLEKTLRKYDRPIPRLSESE